MDILSKFAVLGSFNEQSWMNLHFWEVFWVLVQSASNWGGCQSVLLHWDSQLKIVQTTFGLIERWSFLQNAFVSRKSEKWLEDYLVDVGLQKMLDGLHEFTLSLVEVFVFWFRKLREFKLLIAKGTIYYTFWLEQVFELLRRPL